jgi:hypothetical protein
MNRTLFAFAGLFSTSSLLLDSAVKSTALLLLAALMAIMLRRDSAATRHLVWLMAMVTMLVVPLMSAVLPQWRVLPDWTSTPSQPVVVETSPFSIVTPADDAVEVLPGAEPVEVQRPSAAAYQGAALPSDSRPAFVKPEIIPESAGWRWNWIRALPLVWAVGFCVLILRLLAARMILWNTQRQAAVLWSVRGAGCQPAKETADWQPEKASHDPLASAIEAAYLQLGIRRAVTLLIHAEKTIPVVWGILRHRLLLPAAARQWSGEQLQSVLLHELAHVKRRDTLVQLLAQIACTLHWFNPLVWFAAWRLGVESERACDDLVLASGVRPSAYAGHLLEVVTGLSPARWRQSCGLAMARKSSLEGRLAAVVSEKLNRRRVSVALATIALAMTVGIAVPIAMLRAADERPGETPKPAASDIKPKGKEAQSLFKKWQDRARMNGNIPGGALGPLAHAAADFVKFNPTDEHMPKLAKVLKRIDTSHDWTPAEAVALLDDVTAVYAPLPRWAEDELRFAFGDAPGGAIHTGQRLPAELASAPWGQAQPNGLRAAWLLEPRAKEYRLGTPSKSRILFHNAGKNVVVFRALTWNQSGGHKARDAKGAEIGVVSIYWTTIPLIVACRLAPGEFMEVRGAGIGVGTMGNPDMNTRTGSWVVAKAGDEVTFTPAPVSVNGKPRPHAEPDWWLAFIKDRLSLDTPLPADAGERRCLLDRAVQDLFGTPTTPEETAAFVADRTPDALDALAKRLAQRAGVSSFSGVLQSGETKFRVLPAKPDVAKSRATPRVAGANVVKGRVIDESGKPVDGADLWLQLFVYGRRMDFQHARADSQGRFFLEVPADWLAELQPSKPWNQLTLWAYAAGHQLGTAMAMLPSGASDLAIRLRPASDTSFVVLDPEGRPYPGALVEPYSIRTWTMYQAPPDELLARVGVRTDAEGRAKLPAVPPDLLSRVRVSTKDYGIQMQHTTESPTIVGAAIRLRPVGKIEGRVIANPPEIARGARLGFTSKDNTARPRSSKEWPTEGLAFVTCDEEGRFAVPAIAAGDVTIGVHVDEKQPLRPRLPASLNVQAGRTTTLEIPMLPTVAVRGSVRVQGTGKPVPGVLVDVAYGVGRQGASVVSDAQGNYTARALPGRIRLQVISMPNEYARAPEDASDPSCEIPASATKFDLPPIEVLPAKSIAGHVVDQQNRPVENIRISVVEGGRHYGWGKSDKNGQFDMVGVPATISPAKAKYEWRPEVSSTMGSACEILKTDPLVLRALPRDPQWDTP